MTHKPTEPTPTEAARALRAITSAKRAESDRRNAAKASKSAGRTPKGYVIRMLAGRWYVYVDEPQHPLVGSLDGYTERHDAIDAAKAHRDKARRAQSAEVTEE